MYDDEESDQLQGQQVQGGDPSGVDIEDSDTDFWDADPFVLRRKTKNIDGYIRTQDDPSASQPEYEYDSLYNKAHPNAAKESGVARYLGVEPEEVGEGVGSGSEQGTDGQGGRKMQKGKDGKSVWHGEDDDDWASDESEKSKMAKVRARTHKEQASFK